MTLHLLALGMPQGSEWLIIFGLALLLFGRRLPEVGRSIGQALVEFKKGLKGVNEDIEDASNRPSSRPQASLPRDSSGPVPTTSPSDARVSRSDHAE